MKTEFKEIKTERDHKIELVLTPTEYRLFRAMCGSNHTIAKEAGRVNRFTPADIDTLAHLLGLIWAELQ